MGEIEPLTLPDADRILAQMLRDSRDFLGLYLEYTYGLNGTVLADALSKIQSKLVVVANPVNVDTHDQIEPECGLSGGNEAAAVALVMEWHIGRHPELREIWDRAKLGTRWLNTAVRHNLFLPTDFMHPPQTETANCSLRGAYRMSSKLGIEQLLPHALLGVQDLGNAVSIMAERISRDHGIDNMGHYLKELRDALYLEYFLPQIQELALLK